MLTFFIENNDYFHTPEEELALSYVRDLPDPTETELDVVQAVHRSQSELPPKDSFADKFYSFFTGEPTPLQLYKFRHRFSPQ